MIKSKVVWLNLMVIAGLIIDFLIANLSSYQGFLTPQAYAVVVAILPVLNIILRVVNPSVTPVVKRNPKL